VFYRPNRELSSVTRWCAAIMIRGPSGQPSRYAMGASRNCHTRSLRCALLDPSVARKASSSRAGSGTPTGARAAQEPAFGATRHPASCRSRYPGQLRRGAARRAAARGTFRCCQPGCAARVIPRSLRFRSGGPRRPLPALQIVRSCATAPPHLFARAGAHFFACGDFPSGCRGHACGPLVSAARMAHPVTA
jgi:hypothetical protein